MEQQVICNEIGQRLKSNLPSGVAKLMKPLVNGALGFGAVDKVYSNACEGPQENIFAENVLNVMNVSLNVSVEQLALIPKEGPLVVVANHPFGGVEGMALMAMLCRVRPDVKLMANYMLGLFPELRRDMFLVDPFGGKEARKTNVKIIRDAMQWVKDGHVLGMFPAGEVSSFQKQKKVVTDGPWSDTAASMIRKLGCNAVCVYFDGHNSKLFQLAGMVNPNLRTLMLPREFIRTKNSPIDIKVSHSIAPVKSQEFESNEDLTNYLRMRTYILSAGGYRDRRGKHRKELRNKRLARFKRQKKFEPVAELENREALINEIRSLDSSYIMKQSGAIKVYCVRYEQIPVAMRELGRLREETFREVGEGTGQSRDIDWWDQHYRHLVMWHDEDCEIMGAYRLGLSDELLEQFGVRGLYSASLYRYSERMLNELTPAIELGRSFIQKKYQRNPLGLGMLWKGIVGFILRNPQYTKLFGPVSISNNYHSMSKQMLVSFLRSHHFDNALAEHVKPTHPPKIRPIKLWDNRNEQILKKIEDLDELIAEIEPHMKNAPVLIRQYLRLNGKFLCFNVDPDFNDSLDALILCDVADPLVSTIVKRYMGKSEYEDFLIRRACLKQ